MEYESDGDTNCIWRTQYSHQRICTGTRGFGNKRTSGDRPNYSIEEAWLGGKSDPLGIVQED